MVATAPLGGDYPPVAWPRPGGGPSRKDRPDRLRVAGCVRFQDLGHTLLAQFPRTSLPQLSSEGTPHAVEATTRPRPKPTRTDAPGRSRAHLRLSVEQLEDRVAPSVTLVKDVND